MTSNEKLLQLLQRAKPIIEAHAGASHMLEGFRPRRNEWDVLAEEVDGALGARGEPAPAQDEREAYSKWRISMEPYGFNGVDAFSAGATWQRTRPAQTEQQPLAWLIDWPEEPELGHYFSDEPNEHARSRPLYAAPIAQTAPQPEQSETVLVPVSVIEEAAHMLEAHSPGSGSVESFTAQDLRAALSAQGAGDASA